VIVGHEDSGNGERASHRHLFLSAGRVVLCRGAAIANTGRNACTTRSLFSGSWLRLKVSLPQLLPRRQLSVILVEVAFAPLADVKGAWLALVHPAWSLLD
jgi:hypothetical protein